MQLQITPETNDKINALIGYVADAVKSGGDMLSEQAPLVAKEIVAWKAAEAYTNLTAYAVVGVALAVALVWLGRKPMWSDEAAGCPTAHGMARIAVAVVSVFYVIACLIGAIPHIEAVVKCHTAPRLVVLDYLRKM